MKIEAPGLRLIGTGNHASTEHHMARARRVKAEKTAVGWALKQFGPRPDIPCTFVITRCAPGNGLDYDGLVHACKATRDAIADWMLVDDKHSSLVKYDYAQARAPWSVFIEAKEGIQ